MYVPKWAMFIFAHPDDIEFVAAGTAARWLKHGSEIIYVVITDGSMGTHTQGVTPEQMARIRRAEQCAAANVIGAECIFLGYHDGLLQPTLELRKQLVSLIRKYKPNAVVCGDPTYYFKDDYVNHPDHRAAAQVVLEAVSPAPELFLLYPDLDEEGLTVHKVDYVYIATSCDANYYIDITETIDLKIEALCQHSSQFNTWNPGEYIRTRSAEIGAKVGFKYAESFRRITLTREKMDRGKGLHHLDKCSRSYGLI